MTNLENRKTKLTIETSDFVRERGKMRAVVIEATNPSYAEIRLKGTRTRFSISYAAIYQHAASLEAARVRREKAEARKARKGGR